MKKSIALVIIDTSQQVLANNALSHSLKMLDFQQILIYSDDQKHWPFNQIIEIQPLENLTEYNKIIIRDIAFKIHTDYCLVIQYDGFIINKEQFSPHFYHYDYIGAPWPHFATLNVGNGGFSWRSRKLIEVVASLPNDDFSVAEDIFICRQQRPLLEQSHGIVFAPPAIASHFSIEAIPVPFPTFGFHGIFHLPQIYRNSIDFLLENLSHSSACKWQHMLLPAFEKISPAAANRFKERLSSQDH